ncbi:SpoIIE family protein phosphatase [Sulfobacillus thermotolerans]|uniref:SpoIIE family protein phosphatase n=1 Tax=Sulfobacillus thermotolerans TaxID=338644 RepID=UPI0033670C26
MDDLLVVIGRDKGSIEDHFDRTPELEQYLKSRGKQDLLDVVMNVSKLADLHFIRQKEPLGLGHAVLSAKRHVGLEPFAVLLGDDVMQGQPPVLKQLIDHWEPGLSVLAVQPVTREEASRYGIVYGNWAADGRSFRVSHLVEKPSYEAAPEHPLAIMGRYILDLGFTLAVRGSGPGGGLGILVVGGFLAGILASRQWRLAPVGLIAGIVLDRVGKGAEMVKVAAAPTFLCRNRRVEIIRSHAVPVGILQEVHVEPVYHTLDPGDLIVMVTDGVLEGADAHAEETLSKLLQEMPTANPQVMAETILSYMLGHDQDGRDDAAVMVVQIKGHRQASRIPSISEPREWQHIPPVPLKASRR